MTRQIVRLDSNNTQQSINLEFDAEILSVINPTAQSIGVSVGGNIPPQTVQSADIWIPADSGINYPVVGRNFAAAFMPPLLVNAPTGIPTAANLFFTAQEAVPNFGAFPLSTLATQSLADVILIPKTDTSALTTYSKSVQITPDIQSLTIGLINNLNIFANLVTLGTQLVGDQSGYVYWQLPSNPNAIQTFNYNVPFFGGADTSVTLTVNYAAAQAGNAVQLIGHRYNIGPSTALSGSVMFVPSPAVYPLKVTPPQYRAADYSAYQAKSNPVGFDNLAAIANIPAGAYYIEWDAACEETAGLGKVARLVNTTAAVFLATVPYPGGRGGAINGYYSSTIWGIAVQNLTALTSGATVYAALRVWNI